MAGTAKSGARAGYHHGDLRNALLAAAEAEVAAHGIEGFSLRGVAKRAGVSHAAPAHHFRDTADLLTALAGIAADRLTGAMQAAMARAAPTPEAQFIASGVGYVRFALDNRALFRVLFGSERPHSEDQVLLEKAKEAFVMLVDCVAALTGKDPMADLRGRLQVASAWSQVHGLANLLIANRLRFVRPEIDADFDAMIAALITPVMPAASR